MEAINLKKQYQTKLLEAGCDEAGRGCLAGPVFAAAVILPENFDWPQLNDSKKLNEKQRNQLREIIESEAVCWAVGVVDHKLIDKINILNASILAMHLAVEQLEKMPEYLIIDGNRFKKYKNIPHSCIVQGDAEYASIAAASILAKTHRDEYMREIDELHPQYFWRKNMGYPTKQHRKAISQFGLTPFHRLSFKQLDSQLKLPL